ncbi:hypothetical protein KOW79_021612 [Hemibagrus wyckioides]|uniref:Uncharacterized protein n=2 Tax=Hemibagrus wyckioides TaxID=337641 RepID=A0A9D3N3T8_9TELE|nr:hypothetical protein KOW79_021612 [Hemibagrus wyckioides]
MCKCDILKALGVETESEEQPMPSVTSDLRSFPSSTEEMNSDPESHTDPAASGYESLQAVEQPGRPDHTHQGLEAVCVDVQPHYDNPAFENETRS